MSARLSTLALSLVIAATSLSPARAEASSDPRFPLPAALAANGHFWLRVYSEWSTGDYAIHDDRQLDVVYSIVKANDGRSPVVKQAKAEVEAALRRLNKQHPKKADALSGIDRQVFQAWAAHKKDPGRFARGMGHVRHQKGQRDRFALALVEAGRLRGHIETILSAHNVPPELLALVFVESMFKPHARSYSGAVGLWQFMPYTGREYLNINGLVDERRDPIVASYAAASYLRSAYKRLGSWPVAITSYNYGMNGMARAVKAVGRSNISSIVQKYRGGRLGFAAKNYYTEFWAALEIWKNPKKYFPKVKAGKSWRYDLLRVPQGLRLNKLVQSGVVSSKRLAALNPALSQKALTGRTALPHGFALRLPKGASAAAKKAIAKMPGLGRSAASAKVRSYKVRRGDSLIGIARRHGLNTGQLLAANGLDFHATIYPGQNLRIPAKTSGFTLLPEARGLAVLGPTPGTAPSEAVAVAKAATPTAANPTAVTAQPRQSRPSARQKKHRHKAHKAIAALPPRPRVYRFRRGKKRYLVLAGPAVKDLNPVPRRSDTALLISAVDLVNAAAQLPKIDLLVGFEGVDLHQPDEALDSPPQANDEKVQESAPPLI